MFLNRAAAPCRGILQKIMDALLDFERIPCSFHGIRGYEYEILIGEKQ
jgi:hypothetical protein